MELIFRSCLFIAGVINTLPAILAFFPQKLKNSYGIEIPNANYELLLRHRAVLFGIIGGMMIYSAIAKKHYAMAVCIGLISMISYIILYKLIHGEINAELSKVMKIDIIGIIILLVGLMVYKLK